MYYAKLCLPPVYTNPGVQVSLNSNNFVGRAIIRTYRDCFLVFEYYKEIYHFVVFIVHSLTTLTVGLVVTMFLGASSIPY